MQTYEKTGKNSVIDVNFSISILSGTTVWGICAKLSAHKTYI